MLARRIWKLWPAVVIAAAFLFLGSKCGSGGGNPPPPPPKTPKQKCEDRGGVWVWKGGHRWGCSIDEEVTTFTYYANFEDKNDDGLVTKADGEIWCTVGSDTGTHVPCRFLTLTDISGECSYYSYTWSTDSNGNSLCTNSTDGIVLIAKDTGGDGYIDLAEYHCETLDGNGNPSGTSTSCLFDEYSYDDLNG